VCGNVCSSSAKDPAVPSKLLQLLPTRTPVPACQLAAWSAAVAAASRLLRGLSAAARLTETELVTDAALPAVLLLFAFISLDA
jgi:hypothetical protein